MIGRREFLGAATSAITALRAAGDEPLRSPLGIATTCYLTAWRPNDTIEFLTHAIELGAAGVQAPLSSSDAAYIRRFRDLAERHGMYYEAMLPLPKPDDSGEFERGMALAKSAGAIAVRTQCLGSRRYETYHSMPEWQSFVEASNAKIRRAVPVAERTKLPLAVENHKDWTADELAALMQAHSSEYLGVCLDFGNNLALLDRPDEVFDKLARYTAAVHLKDMALEPAGEGFLLSEVVLGEGIVDWRRGIAAVKKARPATRITLEMITRDPLLVPCLTDDYWATFPERSGLKLARILRAADEPGHRRLPRVRQQSPAALRRLEEENVRSCLRVAANFV